MARKTKMYLLKGTAEARELLANRAPPFPAIGAGGAPPFPVAWTHLRAAIAMAYSINDVAARVGDANGDDSETVVVEVEFDGDLRQALRGAGLFFFEQESCLGPGTVYLFLGVEVWQFLNERCRAVRIRQ